MDYSQIEFQVKAPQRGCHLITEDVLEALDFSKTKAGILHLFCCHTSAGIGINESYDPDVRRDMDMALERLVPRDWPYVHTLEGSDDMPAHIKAALIGNQISIPIRNGKLHLGTWQGIYLYEFLDKPRQRTIVATF